MKAAVATSLTLVLIGIWIVLMAVVLALVGVMSESGLVKVITSIWDKLVKVLSRSGSHPEEESS